ncbi:MAG: hypothetical protein CMJ25_07165 [Phycisphaerae bacterium]|jgi:hypothetical protein|nr:hypothetical protein [Phycisphaerae bacterium]
MSDEIMGTEAETETVAEQSQETKTFTQDELDRIVADRVAREQRKFDKKLSGVDIDEAKELLAQKEAAELERQKERGEFDNILKKTVEKKDMEIQSYKSKLQQTLVDGAILGAASNNNAVNPNQVSQLLKTNTRLSDDGNVEVLDDNGTPRYNDSGDLLSVNEMVAEFLTVNPHMVKASQGGTGSMGNAGGSTQKPQSVADMVANWNDGGKEAFAAMKKA